MDPAASSIVTLGMVLIVSLVIGLFLLGYSKAGSPLGEPQQKKNFKKLSVLLFLVAWLFITGLAAKTGVLAQFDRRPPPLALMIAAIFAISVGAALSPLGRKFATGLPIWALIGAQSFRFPLEIVMHQAAREGVMPVEMSFSGMNYDIFTGISAIVVAILAYRNRAPRWLLWSWDIVGIVLLVAIIVIAIAATPMFRAFGNEPEHLNTWVVYFPFVWLPAVLVSGAIFGHIVITRRLIQAR